jgi:DNA-binding transcriptional LysR family regulator
LDRIDVMRLFVRIVDRGSFAAAARDLGLPRASVTRAVQQLEARLGTRLLERTTRVVRPTGDGWLYHARCADIVARADDADGMFDGVGPRGPLRADLQGTLARFFVLPALADFAARYPGIALSLSEGDRMVDLVAEGVDCVLRAGELPDSALVGRQVAAARQLTLASPAYLSRFGMPDTIDDLAGHRMVAYPASATGQPYPLDFVVDGQAREVALPHDISVRGAELYTAAGVGGFGLIQVPRYRVLDAIDAGALVVVLPDHSPPPMPISVLHPGHRHLSPRVALFADWLADLFAAAQRDDRL